MIALKACLFGIILAVAKGQASFRLANFYQDDMVLQMEPKRAILWGYGEVGAQIEINYENHQIVSGVNADGTWRIELLPHAAGGPVDFEIIHNNVDIANLSAWFGDVWVCSGQSNMDMGVQLVYNSTEESAKALEYSNIRLLRVKRDFNLDVELAEVNDFATSWSAPNATNVAGFSALCLFYGERMSDSFDKNRPIGLIDATWGGTRIEAWISQKVPVYCLTPPNEEVNQNSESALWNAMIAPLSRSTVRGAIWYQGEANVNKDPDFYSCHITAMVQDWKNTFPHGHTIADNDIAFPFGIVQLATTLSNDFSKWGDLRMHQTADQGVLPNPFIPEGFMAAAYDLTDHASPTGPIHPRDKQTIADRLANAAKNLLYGENFKRYGPIPTAIAEDSPGQITITYDMNIRIGGPDGFAFKKADDTWQAALINVTTINSVTVAVDADATLLALGYSASVCKYKQCAVYSDDAENLPAQVWKWDLATVRHEN